jgi:hypothetical protein
MVATIKNQNIRSQQEDITLRDARHAHNFYTSDSFAFAPKTKYLYHVVFFLNPEAEGKAVTTAMYGKQISMLVKQADLPGFSAQVDTKKQYNRVKHLQTAVEYDPINIRFHDDNNSVTSMMFEEYYRYYFRDGNKFVNPGESIDYNPRDLYSERVPRYGMDKPPTAPFFREIKIFQMSRQRWRAYTLINPLIDKWQHDSLDNTDTSGTMENTMSIMYEGVLYSEGQVSIESDPVGFGSQETLYDTVPSPLGTNENYPNLTEEPRIPGQLIPAPERPVRFNNNGSISFNNPYQQQSNDPGGFPNIQFPSRPRPAPASTLGNNNAVPGIDGDRIVNALSADSEVLNSFVNRALMTGNVSGYSVNNFQDFLNLAPNTRNAITDELLTSVTGGNRKLQQIASQAIRRATR